MSTSLFNRRWAKLLLEALTRHGVRHICIAPGSRSTPLTQAAAGHERLICHTHFDERGLGHLALGLAEASRTPVAVVVTSGTAAANLYPAVIEAGLTGERLVVLTADRPPELIDCGANQAIRQQGLFATHAAAELNLPRPTPELPARWLASAVDDAMMRLEGGALHINCPFAEPLYDADEGETRCGWLDELGDWWRGSDPWLRGENRSAPPAPQEDWEKWRTRSGLVIAGRMPPEQGERLAEWALRLGWPLVGDVLSHTGQPLPCADLWLAHPAARRLLDQAEIVLQFGSSLTGKRLLQWQEQCRPQEYWLIDTLPGRLDPAHHRGRRLAADIGDWLTAHPPQEPDDGAPARAGWAAELEAFARRARRGVAEHLSDRFGEAQLAHRVAELLPPGGQLFVGNSLTIRLIDAFARLPAGYPVYGNRGASGIDGLISTLAGVQRADDRPTLGIVGDLSALYDMNALALLRQAPAPLVLIVVNNNGGRIFSLLPTPAAQREDFYCMPHGLEFGHAAAMFGLNYVRLDGARAERWEQMAAAVAEAWSRGGVTLLELVVPPDDGAETLRHLVAQVAAW